MTQIVVLSRRWRDAALCSSPEALRTVRTDTTDVDTFKDIWSACDRNGAVDMHLMDGKRSDFARVEFVGGVHYE